MAGLLGVVACQAQVVRTAPFRERPDSVRAGSLGGPFDGEVVEATTGRPIAGALIYATWSLQSGYGMNRPGGHHEIVVSSDAEGKYTIPRLAISTERGVRVTDFYLVVYKRGYVAYRSDRRFSDLGPRRDFAQSRNRIELERWRDEYSHARHLRFIGGGPAISALTRWEADEAAAELSSGGPGAIRHSDIVPPQTGTYLVAAQLLTADDVKKITGFDGEFESGPLSDEPDTASYSSQHLKALRRPENYDLALRLWRLEGDQALARYRSLVESLPGVEETNEIADQSLRATEGNIFGISFVDVQRKVVVLLTCGQGQCDSADVAARLGQHVHRRMVELWPSKGL